MVSFVEDSALSTIPSTHLHLSISGAGLAPAQVLIAFATEGARKGRPYEDNIVSISPHPHLSVHEHGEEPVAEGGEVLVCWIKSA